MFVHLRVPEWIDSVGRRNPLMLRNANPPSTSSLSETPRKVMDPILASSDDPDIRDSTEEVFGRHCENTENDDVILPSW